MNSFKDLCNINNINKYKERKIIKRGVCRYEECKKEAKYNIKSQNIGAFCNTHKKENMIDITRNLCIDKDCYVRANYNYINETKGIYCDIHKKDNMFNVINKTCKKENCKIRPSYNYENEKCGLYCKNHKLKDMIDVNNFSKQCIEINCSKRANCNYFHETKALYCADHKLDNMQDIMSKRCKEYNCNKFPSFNFINNPGSIYCKDHKKNTMVDTTHKKCIFKNCDLNPSFNYKNEKISLYCKLHKLDNMIDIVHKRCKTELCDIQIRNKFKGYCLRCFIYNFPNDKLVRDYGTREAKVSEFIKETYPDLNITYNKIINEGCSNHRPDIFIDCLTHSVIVEVDENQHKAQTYNPECELRRLNDIYTSLADRPIIFIRINPDSYTNSKNKLIKSCFEYTEDRGLPKANKTLQTRLKKLKEVIDENLTKVPSENINIIKLYYDGF
jgi:hypothetical protein